MIQAPENRLKTKLMRRKEFTLVLPKERDEKKLELFSDWIDSDTPIVDLRPFIKEQFQDDLA
jgi:hypothetical protein